MGSLEYVISKYCLCSSTYVSAFGFVGFILFCDQLRCSETWLFLLTSKVVWISVSPLFVALRSIVATASTREENYEKLVSWINLEIKDPVLSSNIGASLNGSTSSPPGLMGSFEPGSQTKQRGLRLRRRWATRKFGGKTSIKLLRMVGFGPWMSVVCCAIHLILQTSSNHWKIVGNLNSMDIYGLGTISVNWWKRSRGWSGMCTSK